MRSARASRRSAGLLVVSGIALVLAAGLVVDRFDLFPGLTFAIQRTPERVPSSRLVPEHEIRQGIPILSLAVGESDLHDPATGLLTHPLERGADWERPAYVSYFDQGALRFASGVGLRIHGGKSRENSPVQSFRLYFERRYGATAFQAGVLFGGRSDPLRQLVVHNDLREDLRGLWWHFVNPLAFDIARQLGAIVPETQPARVVLNGQALGAYVLTEHVTSRGFQDAHFGHRGFTVADTDAHEALWRWQRERERLTVSSVDDLVDLDNLTSWFISVLFCATTDAFQGVMLRDDSTARPRWFWVNWDMDHSFMDLYQQAPVPWEHDTFATLLGRCEIRSGLLTRLLVEDPRFAVRFKQTLADALNHRLTPAFLMERFEHYGRLVDRLQVPNPEYLSVLADFLRRRPDALRRLAARHLPRGESRRATLAAPPSVTFRVDDRDTGAGYEGWYFDDTAIRISVTGTWRDRFEHWTINGTVAPERAPDLTHIVGADVRIEAVFR